MTRNIKILQSGLLVFSLTLVTRLLATAKSILMADKFGMTGVTDAFNIAFILPTALIYMSGITVLKGMTSSIFSSDIAHNKTEALAETYSTVLNLALLLTGTVTIAGIVFMPEIIRWYVPEIKGETFTLTVHLARILFPILITWGLADYLGSVSYAFRNFFLPEASRIIAFLFIVGSLVFFADRYGIVSLAWGWAIGFLICFLIQFFYIAISKLDYKAVISLGNDHVKSFFRKSAPLVFVTAFQYIVILIDRRIATAQFEGAVSSITYSIQVYEISLSLFVLPLMTVLLPEFARDAVKETTDELKNRIKFGVETLITIIFFWSCFLFIFNKEIIQVLFQRGAFTEADTVITGTLLSIYTIGLIFQAVQLLLVFIYLGLQKTKALALIGSFSFGLNTIMLLVLSKIFGIYGLAAAYSATQFIYAVLLFWNFKLRYIRFKLRKNLFNLMKIGLAGIVCAILFKAGHIILFKAGGQSTINTLLMLFTIFGITGIVYIIILNYTGILDINIYISKVRNYFNGR